MVSLHHKERETSIANHENPTSRGRRAAGIECNRISKVRYYVWLVLSEVSIGLKYRVKVLPCLGELVTSKRQP